MRKNAQNKEKKRLEQQQRLAKESRVLKLIRSANDVFGKVELIGIGKILGRCTKARVGLKINPSGFLYDSSGKTIVSAATVEAQCGHIAEFRNWKVLMNEYNSKTSMYLQIQQELGR